MSRLVSVSCQTTQLATMKRHNKVATPVGGKAISTGSLKLFKLAPDNEAVELNVFFNLQQDARLCISAVQLAIANVWLSSLHSAGGRSREHVGNWRSQDD